MTREQQTEALAICDRILQSNERAHTLLSEGLKGLIEAFDEMARICSQPDRDRLFYKYAHIGCPAARMEDNCAHPDRCADNGRCIDLGPSPFDKGPASSEEGD